MLTNNNNSVVNIIINQHNTSHKILESNYNNQQFNINLGIHALFLCIQEYFFVYLLCIYYIIVIYKINKLINISNVQ